jgi:hypothetical protein
MSHRVARFFQKVNATENLPEIRWADVTRIQAMGTDAFSAFQVWLKFTYGDGTKAEVTVEMKGYWDIVDLLHERLPSVPADWYDRMAETPWHADAVLYDRGF